MYFELPGSTVRVLGSIHIFPQGVDEPPKFVQSASGWADSIVLEGDLTSLQRVARGTPKKRLRDALPPETWRFLERIWPQQKNSPHPPFQSILPWALWLYLNGFIIKGVPGVEAFLSQEAMEQVKPVIFLEGEEDLGTQAEFAPEEDWCNSIHNLASDPRRVRDHFVAVFDAWRNADLPRVSELIDSAPGSTETMKRALIVNRNLAWLPKIKELMQSQKDVLIAVGVAHLCGPGNLFELLGVTPRLVDV